MVPKGYDLIIELLVEVAYGQPREYRQYPAKLSDSRINLWHPTAGGSVRHSTPGNFGYRRSDLRKVGGPNFSVPHDLRVDSRDPSQDPLGPNTSPEIQDAVAAARLLVEDLTVKRNAGWEAKRKYDEAVATLTAAALQAAPPSELSELARRVRVTHEMKLATPVLS